MFPVGPIKYRNLNSHVAEAQLFKVWLFNPLVLSPNRVEVVLCGVECFRTCTVSRLRVSVGVVCASCCEGEASVANANCARVHTSWARFRYTARV